MVVAEDRAHPSGKPTGHGLVSLVVPVYNEADNIVPLLEKVSDSLASSHETILVYDMDEDTTLPPARQFQDRYPELRLVKNIQGRGVLNALRSGIASARGDVVVVTMADLSDDVTQIDDLAVMTRAGFAVVAPSRYMRGGGQIGGPPAKRFLSRLAGLSLHWMTGIGTHDPTNNFKAYDSCFLSTVVIESTRGFEIALELTTKAHLAGLAIAETPTVWRDRTAGESRFQVLNWLPAYLRWYSRCVIGTWAGKRRRAMLAATVTSSRRRSAD